MQCKRCGGDLVITNTYKAYNAKTQLGVCKECNHKHTLVTTIYNHFDGRPVYGQGPKAILQKIQKEPQPEG